MLFALLRVFFACGVGCYLWGMGMLVIVVGLDLFFGVLC